MPRLLVLTDRTQVPTGRTLRDVLDDVAAAGLGDGGALVLREVDLPDHDRSDLAAHARSLGLPVLAAHRALPGCLGVHLPAGAAALPDVAWGRSCHTRAEVAAAAATGARWATLSPYAASASKPGYGPPLPPEVWADLPMPVHALGGIDTRRAVEARAAGAYGVAVMGAVMRAEAPGAVVVGLLAAVAA
ncbi:thiamine phosphate synthase [Nocardioides sp. J54]|uniref:thiamine phosphate synthase n=1 Tax=Nocardioides sp. J54 TaxID=935866 RepID=UPI00055D60AE|nr:thiamine phosphate synthase [Nocardioides sp. J54]